MATRQLFGIWARGTATNAEEIRRQGASPLAELAGLDSAAVLDRLCTRVQGLIEDEAAARLDEAGLNAVTARTRDDWPWRLLRAMRNPLVVLLVARVVDGLDVYAVVEREGECRHFD